MFDASLLLPTSPQLVASLLLPINLQLGTLFCYWYPCLVTFLLLPATLLLPASLLLLMHPLLLESHKMNKTFMILFTVVDHLQQQIRKIRYAEGDGPRTKRNKTQFLYYLSFIENIIHVLSK